MLSSAVLHGLDLESEHCMFENQSGKVTLVPLGGAQCSVNGVQVTEPSQLNQGEASHQRPRVTSASEIQTVSQLSLCAARWRPGAVILLGRTNMFRFNHPKEAAKLREKRKVRPSLGLETGPADGVSSPLIVLFAPIRVACSPHSASL